MLDPIANKIKESIGTYSYRFDEKHLKTSGIRIAFDYLEYKYGKEKTKKLILLLNQAIEKEFFNKEYFYDDVNWISYEIYQSIWELSKVISNDKKFVYNAGKNYFKFNRGGVITLAKYLGSVKDVYQNIPNFVNKYNNQVTLKVEEVQDNKATLTLTLKPLFWKRFKSKPNLVKNGCDLLKGIFESVPTLFDFPPAESVDLRCVSLGHRSCEWKFIWKDAPIAKRLWNSIVASDYKKLLKEQNEELSNTIQILEIKLDELRDKNKEIIQYQEQLIEKEKTESAAHLISELAHDLKTPISMISGYSQLIKMGSSKEDTTKYSDMIYEQCNRTIGIISDLHSHIKGEPPIPKLSTINLIPFMKEFHKELAPSYKGKNIEVYFNSDSNDVPVSIDKEQFRRVIHNLCKNAKEAMPEGGELYLNVNASKKNAIIDIKDSGIGIPKDQQNKIFDRFVSYKKDGTGLGLFIVKRIIEAHDGNISIRSQLNKGTTISIILPLVTSQQS